MKEKLTPQEKKIVSYFKESTGSSFLDSGGTDGRHWQQNRKRKIWKFDQLITYSSYDGTPEIALHVWLNDLGKYDAAMTTFIRKYLKKYADTEFYNVYNEDNDFSQVFLYIHSDNIELPRDVYEAKREFLYVSIHNGCDVRGGYGSWFAIELDENTQYWRNRKIYAEEGQLGWYDFTQKYGDTLLFDTEEDCWKLNGKEVPLELH